jgi:tripartite-type tricarboxylate transporter receptor subunit TctC
MGQAKAKAHAWSDSPLRLIVPYLFGGAVDLAGRLIAEGQRERLGQPVIEENPPGAGGNIGVAAAAKAAAAIRHHATIIQQKTQ